MSEELTIADYEQVQTSHNKLVRELDLIWNGPAGAAQQASLCDILAQFRKELPLVRDSMETALRALADIARSDDLTLQGARNKARRVYETIRESLPEWINTLAYLDHAPDDK